MTRARTRIAFVVVLVLGCLGLAPGASAAVSQAEIDRTVTAGAAWLRTQQAPSGLLRGFDGDWATTTLAAGGINTADVRGAGTVRSLQDYWAMTYGEEEWAELPSQIGPGQIGKAALIGWSAGLWPTRIAPDVNLAADLASIYDWNSGALGGTKNTNAFGFALLGMPYLGMPAAITERATEIVLGSQHTDGGWTYETGGSTPGDIDMTGAALAMVCSNGYGPGDPPVAKGLQFLRGLENETTGALEDKTPGIPAINAPSMAWALIGIQACGEDPQGPSWTVGAGTPGESNPVQYALETLVITAGPQAGAIRYEPASTTTDSRNVNATEALARALAGDLFTADPPPRENPALPAVRPAPSVAAGATVPIALTVEGAPGPARMCAVRVPNGAPLVEALRSAEASSVPAGCITGVQAQGPWVTSLDGATPADPAGGWVFSTPGSAERRVGAQPVGFGDVVRLRLENGPLPGALYASSTGLDFGSVAMFSQTTRTFTVTDAFAPVQIASLPISRSPDFSLAAQDCAGRILAVGSSCSVTVRYGPGEVGADGGALSVIAADGTEALTVALAGNGIAAPTTAKLRPPRIKVKRGVAMVGKRRVAVFATLVCLSSPCKVQTPKRVALGIAGRRYRADVLAPRQIPAGGAVPLGVKVPRAAVKALRGRTTKLAMKVRLVSPGAVTVQTVRARLGRRLPGARAGDRRSRDDDLEPAAAAPSLVVGRGVRCRRDYH